MKRVIKKVIMITCLMSLFVLFGCADKSKTNSEEDTSVIVENDLQTAALSDEAKPSEKNLQEKDGVVYVEGEELSLEKLLEMVAEASSEYRFTSVKQDVMKTCLDNETKRLYTYVGGWDNDLFVKAYDTLSGCYHHIKLYPSGGSEIKYDMESMTELFSSFLDYELKTELEYNTTTYTITLDDTTTEGTTYYKIEVLRSTDDKSYRTDYFIDASTNLLVKYDAWIVGKEEESFCELTPEYLDEFPIDASLDYELEEKDYKNNEYKWYTGEEK